MKIKNAKLVALLTTLGVAVKAELVVDDANGTSLTFPDISDIAEIAEGVAIDAPDGTYTIADGDNAITIVCAGGSVTSVTTDEPNAEAEAEVGELDAEVAAVLETIVEQVQALKAENVKLVAELKGLKVSLKHEVPANKVVPEATAVNQQFKVVQ